MNQNTAVETKTVTDPGFEAGIDFFFGTIIRKAVSLTTIMAIHGVTAYFVFQWVEPIVAGFFN